MAKRSATIRVSSIFTHLRDRYAYFGNVSGGIGWTIAAASVDIQLAPPERKVVALLGDRSPS